MKNKISNIIFFLAIFTMCIFSGCDASSEVVSDTPNEETFIIKSQAPVNSSNLEGGKLKSMVPDPYEFFPKGGFTTFSKITDKEDQQSFFFGGITEDDFNSYVRECREMGFTDVTLTQDGVYWANHVDEKVKLEVYFTEFEDQHERDYVTVMVSKINEK